MRIDWSKALEGATHYHPGTTLISAHWWKKGTFCNIGFEHEGWQLEGKELQDWTKYIPRPVIYEPWNGEGLPPVGAVCELKQRVLFAGAHDSKWFEEGDQVEVGGHALFSGAEGAVCSVCVVGQNYTGTLIHEVLRPIRTPEQIAAEEREKAVGHMWSVWNANFEGHVKDGLYALYDSGYIKKVQP